MPTLFIPEISISPRTLTFFPMEPPEILTFPYALPYIKRSSDVLPPTIILLPSPYGSFAPNCKCQLPVVVMYDGDNESPKTIPVY